MPGVAGGTPGVEGVAGGGRPWRGGLPPAGRGRVGPTSPAPPRRPAPQMHQPARKAVDAVHRVLSELVPATLASERCAELSRYRNLREEVEEAAGASLGRFRARALGMVEVLVDMEASYLTAEFFREILASPGAEGEGPLRGPDGGPLPLAPPPGTPPDRAALWRISRHVMAYLQVVSNQLTATVPKAVVHCQVVPAKEAALEPLRLAVGGKDSPGLRRLLAEDEAVARRRAQCASRLSLLRKARREIAESIGW